MLLIITNTQDLAVDYLVNYFSKQGRDCFRLNSDRLDDVSIVAEFGGKNDRIKFQTPHRSVNLNKISSVLYRRAFTPQIRGEYGSFRSREYKAAFEGALLTLNDQVTWVNPLRSTEIAEHKTLQLFMAKKIGFQIPITLISNSSSDVREFLTEKTNHLAKPVSHGLILEPHGSRSIYAELIDKNQNISSEEITSSPVIFQNAITEKYDVRMTIIGDQVFTVKIDGLSEGQLDWRKDSERVFYTEITPPGRVVDMCRQLMTEFSLLYAAIDFVVDINDEWFFLEINPVGEWAWLEESLGLPMRRAFERLLYQ